MILLTPVSGIATPQLYYNRAFGYQELNHP
jgi:hypothetical protein